MHKGRGRMKDEGKERERRAMRETIRGERAKRRTDTALVSTLLSFSLCILTLDIVVAR